QIGTRKATRFRDRKPLATIVGVVDDVRRSITDAGGAPTVFAPHVMGSSETPQRYAELWIRTATPPHQALRPIATTLRGRLGRLRLTGIQPMTVSFAREVQVVRTIARMVLTLFG